MKYLLLIIFLSACFSEVHGQGITRYGQSTSSGTDFIDTNGKIWNEPFLSRNGQILRFNPKVGDTFQGGTVFYILQSGDPGYIEGEVHGLIATPSVLGSVQWGCSGTAISGADGTAIGIGAQNTADIISGCPTPGIAAALCAELVLNGFDDWFLPSKDELNKLMIYLGGYPGSHWSSSETGATGAWSLSNLPAQSTIKIATCKVRPIRKF